MTTKATTRTLVRRARAASRKRREEEARQEAAKEAEKQQQIDMYVEDFVTKLSELLELEAEEVTVTGRPKYLNESCTAKVDGLEISGVFARWTPRRSMRGLLDGFVWLSLARPCARPACKNIARRGFSDLASLGDLLAEPAECLDFDCDGGKDDFEEDSDD